MAEIGAAAESKTRSDELGPSTESLVQSRLPASLAATLRDNARWRLPPDLPESEYGGGRLDLRSSMISRTMLNV